MTKTLYQKTVTIWNYLAGGTWTKETWYPTVISNVRLVVSKGNNVLRSGLATADTARLHISDDISIPDKAYINPIAWQNHPDTYYTLVSNDHSFFTEGDSSTEDSTQSNFFEYMKSRYEHCYKISSVDRFEVIPHFEVFGK